MRDDSSLRDAPFPESRGSGPPSNLGCRAATEDNTLRFMQTPADALRRWLGLFCLTMAGGMLIWGQTVLKPLLEGVGFLLYWAGCFLFTFAAIGIALLDMRAVRQRVRAEQEALIRRTLANLEHAEESSPTQGEVRPELSDAKSVPNQEDRK
jgi:hypothetical protein